MNPLLFICHLLFIPNTNSYLILVDLGFWSLDGALVRVLTDVSRRLSLLRLGCFTSVPFLLVCDSSAGRHVPLLIGGVDFVESGEGEGVGMITWEVSNM